jgi:CDP-diacylglycerol--glycerol-3-phosphate 3-phosphatidyltransferase
MVQSGGIAAAEGRRAKSAASFGTAGQNGAEHHRVGPLPRLNSVDIVESTPTSCHPAIALLALAIIVFFAVRNWMWINSIPLPEGAGSAGFLGARARIWYRDCTAPIVDALAGSAVGPNALTYAQGALAIVTGFAFANGAMFIAGWLVIATGTLDVLDGSLARHVGQDTVRGAFVDSVVDRYAEVIIYGGLAVYFRDSWVLWVIALAMFGSMMVSYTRARAEGLGVDCPVGAAQRPERVVLLGLGSVLSDLAAHGWCAVGGQFSQSLLVLILVVLATISNMTAFGRARWVARQLTGAA